MEPRVAKQPRNASSILPNCAGVPSPAIPGFVVQQRFHRLETPSKVLGEVLRVCKLLCRGSVSALEGDGWSRGLHQQALIQNWGEANVKARPSDVISTMLARFN